ncbi:MAG: GDSL-type esterase/lipase family protein [Ginsengibacter sp.]
MNSKNISQILVLSIISFCGFCFSVKPKINIVFIGDSITQGEEENRAPPFFATSFLKKQLGAGRLQFSNQGVSGCTTVDFLPSTATHFPKVVNAADQFYADKQATLIFSIMLGTNDSAVDGPLGSPVSPGSYSNNLKVIIDSLLHSYPASKVIINYPIWYSPNTYNGSKYLKEGLTRLQTYLPVIDALVHAYSKTNAGHVFTGDKKAFHYFKSHYLSDMKPENGQQGVFYLHPNVKGAKQLGLFWSNAISKFANRP